MNDIFVISDLHIGDQGPRDNFHHMAGGNREWEFNNFLDYVERHDGYQLIIAGDLFELWQSNVSKVLTCRPWIVQQLVEMNATYQLGNHDADLKYFVDRGWLKPRLFHRMTDDDIVRNVGGKRILITHGHKQDPYCASDKPGIGRISAIYAGMREDRNGSPVCDKYGSKTVEARSLGHWDRFSRLCRRLVGKPNATQEHRQAMVKVYEDFFSLDPTRPAAVIYGHTHEPGLFCGLDGDIPIWNAGTWADEVNTFVHIKEDGTINLMNWAGNHATPNVEKLNVNA